MFDTKAESDLWWTDSIKDELRRRIHLAQTFSTERLRAVAVTRIKEDSEDSLVAFVKDWCWASDPRNQEGGSRSLPVTIPVLPWHEQEELLREFYRREKGDKNLLIEKSRDTGVTWLAVYYSVWRWLGKSGWAGVFGNRKAELIDKKGDPKAIFWKIRFTIDHLPKWMLPAGYQRDKHDNYKRIINPENGATITGEAGDDAGRGGRASWYFFDEWGSLQHAESVEAALSANTNCLIRNGTATDMNTHYAKLRHSGRVDVLTLSWETDPRKWKTWRDEFFDKYGPTVTRREVDIDYTSGDDLSFIPMDWIRAAVNWDPDAGPAYKTTAGFDVAGTGNAESVLVFKTGPFVHQPDAWRGTDPHDGGMMAIQKSIAAGVDVFIWDVIGVGASIGGLLRTVKPSFTWEEFNAGGKVGAEVLPDSPKPMNERFLNAKAAQWWRLRMMFWKTWKLMGGDDTINQDDCISIPSDNVLIHQLNAPRLEITARQLIKVESKDNLKRRGIDSPDRADALVMASVKPKGKVKFRFMNL